MERAAAQRLGEALERRDIGGPDEGSDAAQRWLAGDARGQQQRVVDQSAAVAERHEPVVGLDRGDLPWRKRRAGVLHQRLEVVRARGARAERVSDRERAVDEAWCRAR
jgi:hypothetical protein